jgi:rfaE bifunctional protein nucleotidyltransferase chain/domain
VGRIINAEEFARLRDRKLKEKKLILATGVFDILHLEHIHFLKKAKAKGDILIVGVESDKRAKQLKGRERPINSQNDRAELLTALSFVDYIFVLPDNLDTTKGRENLIEMVRPDIYAVSQNTPFISEKSRVMEKLGGKTVVVCGYNPEVSTTIILGKLSKGYKC